jgi:hypothetical protein
MKPRQGFVPNPSDDSDDDGRPQYVSDAFESEPISIERDRHATVASPVPAVLAESMRPTSLTPTLARDPAAPVPHDSPEPTRKVGNDHRQDVRHTSPPTGNDSLSAHRRRAAACIDEVRHALNAGELAKAAVAAEAAMHEADAAPPPGIVEVIEPARPLIIRALAAYVGPLGAVAVPAPSAPAIARTRLGNAQRAVLARVDGVRSLEEVFDGSGLGLMDTLRTAAVLVRTGAIRLILMGLDP